MTTIDLSTFQADDPRIPQECKDGFRLFGAWQVPFTPEQALFTAGYLVSAGYDLTGSIPISGCTGCGTCGVCND